MTDPLVSAIINTYNYGRFVGEAVESVLAQDYRQDRMEIIVVDDESTDDTRARMAEFGDRIRYFRVRHGGQAAALNFGIGKASGDIVAFLDADDVWQPNKVRRAVEAFRAHPEAGMVYHAFELWRPDGRPVLQPQFQAISGVVPERVENLLRYDGQATSGQALQVLDALRNYTGDCLELGL